MPFRALTDIEESAKYQRNLRTALADATAEVQDVTLYEGFHFKEQTAPLLVVGPPDASLARKILESGATKQGYGELACIGRDLLLKGSTGLNKINVDKALKIAKHPLQVRVLRSDEDIRAELQGSKQKAVNADGRGTAAASSAQGMGKDKADLLYQPLLLRLDDALGKLAEGEEKTKVQALKAKLASEHKEQDWVQLASLCAAFGKALEAVEARIAQRAKEKKAYENKRESVQKLLERESAQAGDSDRQLLQKEWGQIEKTAGAEKYVEAESRLDALPKLLSEVAKRTLEANRQRLVEAQEAAKSQLDDPSKIELGLLAKAAAAVEKQIEAHDTKKVDSELLIYAKAVESLLVLREAKAQAEELLEQVQTMWSDHEWKLKQIIQGKVKGELPILEKEIEKGEWKPAVKRANVMLGYMMKDLASQQDLAKAMEQANARLQKSMNKSKVEDDDATSYGNSQFASGMVKTIWAAAKKVRSDSPANGAIANVHALGDVEAAIRTWSQTNDDGILTNFHVPGGGRPQAKWEKDFTRPQVQANFCCYWRSNKINIHVDVELTSYFAAYGDEIDWTLVPNDVRKLVGKT
jgi:hypothetical protein